MGYKRGSYALRIEGDSRIPTPFDVFGFKAIASTKIFHPTLESRSIIINMAQAKPEKIIINGSVADDLRAKLLYFKFKYLSTLPISQPCSLSGRIIEIMTPLFTVAQIFKDLSGVRVLISYDDLISLLNDQIKEMESTRKNEEHESDEALILESIQKIDKDLYRNDPEFVYIKDIARDLNWIDDREISTSRLTTKQSTMKISYILKAMGLHTTRIHKGTCIKVGDPAIQQRLIELYNRYLKPI